MKGFNAVAHMVAVGVLMAIAGSVAAQQDYPSKPIRFITPYAPGGSTTIVLRLVGQKLSERWGQQVVIDNRPGGNTIIGTEALVKSPPDGYTMILVNSTHVINSLLIRNLPYDAIRDFAPVTTVYDNETILLLHPSLPVDNLQEFIAYAKSRPGQLNNASGGTGGITHLRAELFNIMAGVNIKHIAYKGTGPVITDLVGGHVQLTIAPPITAIAHVKAGRLKAIAVTGAARLSTLPEVPTFAEAGLPGFEMKNWNGILAPAGAPREIVNKLAAEVARIVVMPDIREKLRSQGLDALVSTPDQFSAMIRAEMARFAKIIETAGIKLEK